MGKDIPQNRRIAAALAVCASVTLLPFAAYAGAMQASICFVVYIIYGQMGTGMAILGICAAGAAAMLGKGSWGMALTVATGVAMMFGAGALANQLGVGNGC